MKAVVALAMAQGNGSGSGTINQNQRNRDNNRHRHHWDHYNPYDHDYYRIPRRHRRDYFDSNLQDFVQRYVRYTAISCK